MEKTLKEKTTSALIWSFIDKFGQQIIYLATGIVLGRILSPDDYGLVGALALFTAISTTLVGSGYSRALMNKPVVSQKELDTVFYYNIAVGLFLYLLLFFCAPLISLFFGKPILTLLSRVLFLTILFTSLSNVQDFVLTKKMDLSNITKANIFSLLPASALAMTAAILGYGVWALVVQTLLMSFLKMIFYWKYGKWSPTRSFHYKILKNLFPFSSGVLMMNLINTVFNNIYSLLIGRIYSTQQLGIYTQGSKYQDIPTGLIYNTFRTVSTPLLSSLNEDKDRLKRVLSKLIKTIALICFPILFGMILIAKPLILALITEKWLGSVPILQILCLSGIFTTLNNVLQESILAKGKSRQLLIVEILKKGVLVLLILFTINQGIIGLAWGWAASSFFTLLVSLYLSNRIIGYSLIDLVKDCLPYFLISSVLCAVAWLLSKSIDNNILFLGFCICFVGILYILFCKIFKLEVAEEMFGWFQKKRKTRSKK